MSTNALKNETKVFIGKKELGKDFLFDEKDFKRYTKKPIPIEAIQINEPFTVETLEGTMEGKIGDFLVIGIKGEMYPVDKEIFKESYEGE
jgi:hypothetical protein